MALPSALANGLPASPFPACPDYAADDRTKSARIEAARRLRDFAAQNLADALRNVELAQLAAKSAQAELDALSAAPRSDRSSPVAGMTSAGAASHL